MGRIDIFVEVSQLSSFLAMPTQGHLVNALHIMSYLKIKHNYRLVLDPSHPGIDMSEFKSNDNSATFYGVFQEDKPLNAPKPLLKEVIQRMFVESEHSRDKSDRRSRTIFMIFIFYAVFEVFKHCDHIVNMFLPWCRIFPPHA